MVVILPSLYVIGVDYYSPFSGNAWSVHIPGQIMSTVRTNSSYFMSTFTTLSGQSEIRLNLYALNSSDGQIEWENNELTAGSSFMFIGQGMGPRLWVYNHTLFEIYVFNGAGSPIGNYTIASFSMSTGKLLGEEVLSYSWGNISNNTNMFAPSVSAEGNHLYLSFITETTYNNGAQGIDQNATFHTLSYVYDNGSYRIGRSGGIPIPTTNAYGTGYINVSFSSQVEAVKFSWINGTIVSDLANGRSSIVNQTGDNMEALGNSVFFQYFSGETLSVYRYNVTAGFSNLLFNSSLDGYGLNLSSLLLSMKVLPGDIFAFTSYEGAIGFPLQVNPDMLCFGLNQSGQRIWNLSIAPDPDGTTFKMAYAGHGDVFLSTAPNGFSSGESYHSTFVLLNYTSGKVLWNHYYGYRVSNPPGSPGFLSPLPYAGQLNVSNGSILYELGQNVALADIPGS